MTEPLRDPFEQSSLDDHSMSALLQKARDGDHSAQNTLMSQLRQYLVFVANQQLDKNLQAKVGPSDVVQQSMLCAVENLEQFQGTTVEEFRGWVRQILVNETRQAWRDYHTQKRDVARERRVTDSQPFGPGRFLADSLPTPGTQACAEEQAAAIQAALDRLPEVDRKIIQWRNWDGLPFEEIADRLDISSSSASRKWYRALIDFKKLLEEDHE